MIFPEGNQDATANRDDLLVLLNDQGGGQKRSPRFQEGSDGRFSEGRDRKKQGKEK
jgi:hypothetical protein